MDHADRRPRIIRLGFAKTREFQISSSNPKALVLQSIDEVVTNKPARSTNQGNMLFAHSHDNLHIFALGKCGRPPSDTLPHFG